jgi:hypothetical protein
MRPFKQTPEKFAFNLSSPERGGASVMGGEHSALPATYSRHPQESVMITSNSLIASVAAETGEQPYTVARIVDAAGRSFLTAFAECEAIPRQQRVEALRTADAFVVDYSESPYSPKSKGFLERLLSKLDRKAPPTPAAPNLTQTRAPGEDPLRDAADILVADDPWAALLAWLANRRALNADIGGEDNTFIGVVAWQTAMLTLPLKTGGRK